MSLVRRPSAQDAKAFKSVRQPGEAAEGYLRRVAGRRGGIGQRDGLAVCQALAEHFRALDAERVAREPQA